MTKDNKRFKLNKENDRNFDISKGAKRKFDLSKDYDDEVSAKPSSSTTSTEQSPVTEAAPATKPAEPTVSGTEETGEKKKGNNKWLWITIAILLAAVLIWLIATKSCITQKSHVPDTIVEQVDSATDHDSETITDTATQDADETAENQYTEGTPIEEIAIPQSQSESESDPEHTHNSAQINASNSVSSTANETQATSYTNVTDDIEAEANKVIYGVYGNGAERKAKLGDKYRTIQNIVNEKMRNL